MSSRTRLLVEDIKRSSQSFYDTPNLLQPQSSSSLSNHRKHLHNQSISKLNQQRIRAKSRYQDLTNMTKEQQKQQIWLQMQVSRINNNKKDWSYAYYTGNKKLKNGVQTFGVYEKKYMQQFPDNTTKHNIQFLERSLHGASIKLPQSESNSFKKPSYKLYSKHYRPIVKKQQQFNQDRQVSPSKFGKIQLDYKRDRIINSYQLQMNPFKTQKSNSLLSKMVKSQVY